MDCCILFKVTAVEGELLIHLIEVSSEAEVRTTDTFWSLSWFSEHNLSKCPMREIIQGKYLHCWAVRISKVLKESHMVSFPFRGKYHPPAGTKIVRASSALDGNCISSIHWESIDLIELLTRKKTFNLTFYWTLCRNVKQSNCIWHILYGNMEIKVTNSNHTDIICGRTCRKSLI